MTILPAENVDLISPFPSRESGRLANWLYCYTNAAAGTDILAGAVASWGIIDRDNTLGSTHECPLVGVVAVSAEGSLSFACSRKAFKGGFAKEALETVLAASPSIREVYCGRANTPVLHLLRSLGFHRTSRTSSPTLLLKLKR